VTGADIDQALANGDMANYLIVAGENAGLLAANLTVWIVMAILMGVAATAMVALCERRRFVARIALFCYWTGVSLVLSAYVAWLAIVVRLAPDNSTSAVLVADVFGWYASRADWVATILVLGLGPALISLAGRGEWVPAWLSRWSIVAVVAAALNAIAMLFDGGGLSTYGFVIIPVGVGWMLAAGVVLLRRTTQAG
jgi:hypothetical protein